MTESNNEPEIKLTEEYDNFAIENTFYFLDLVVEQYLTEAKTISNDFRTPPTNKINLESTEKIQALTKILIFNYNNSIKEDLDPLIRKGLLLQSWTSLGAILEGCLLLFLKTYNDSFKSKPFIKNRTNNSYTIEKVEYLRFVDVLSYFFDVVEFIDQKVSCNDAKTIRLQRNTIHALNTEPLKTWKELNDYSKKTILIILELIDRHPQLLDYEGNEISLCNHTLRSEVNRIKYSWITT